MDVSIRDSTFEEYQKFVIRCISRNIALIMALQLEIEDVKQELSIRLFRAIERYDSERTCPLPKFLYHELQHEILNIKARHKPHGVVGVPKNERPGFICMNQPREDGMFFELPTNGDFDSIEVKDALSTLPADEQAVVIRKMNGEPIRKKVDKQLLVKAQFALASYFRERTQEYA